MSTVTIESNSWRLAPCVLLTGWLVNLFEGYDVGVMSAVLP